MELYNPQSVLRTLEGDRFSQSVHSRGACIDINLLPSTSESEDELLAKQGATFIFSSSKDTQAPANGLNCASSDLKSGPPQQDILSKFLCLEHEGTIDHVSLQASGSIKKGAFIDSKKLRLSKEKWAVLEGAYKEHSTLNPKQKIALAQQLNLQPRQVEVWFQNRRARSKLKQTQADCKMLKRCCKALSEENRRLQQEIAELRVLMMMRGGCVIPHAGCCMANLTMGASYKCLTPQHAFVAPATSATTSISSFNQPSNIRGT